MLSFGAVLALHVPYTAAVITVTHRLLALAVLQRWGGLSSKPCRILDAQLKRLALHHVRFSPVPHHIGVRLAEKAHVD